MVANSYNAENGRNSGAQIMLISQNGTNEFHGSAFFKWHRPGLNAYPALERTRQSHPGPARH